MKHTSQIAVNADLESGCRQASLSDQQPLQVSVFQNKQWQANTVIADVIASIKSGACLEGLTESNKPETNETLFEHYRYKKFRAVLWSGIGTQANRFMVKRIDSYNGLFYIHFTSLSSERHAFIYNALRDDPYTYILFTSLLGLQEIHWVIKATASHFRFKSFVYKIAEYLELTYGVTKKEISADTFVEGRLCYLIHDVNVYSSPSSMPMLIPKRGAIKPVDKVLPATPVTEVQIENSVICPIDATVTNDCNNESPFSHELKTTALLKAIETLVNWYQEKYVKSDEANGSSANDVKINKPDSTIDSIPAVQITIKRDDNINGIVSISFAERYKNKNTHILTFERNSINGAIVVGGSGKSNGKPEMRTRKIATSDIYQHLVDLLNEGELPVGEVYEKIAPRVNRSPRTVRAEVAKILSGKSVLQINTGKPFKLAKRRAGKDYFLFLESLE